MEKQFSTAAKSSITLASNGLLLESDCVSLSSNLALMRGQLYDPIVNVRHDIALPAYLAIQYIRKHTTAYDWYSFMNHALVLSTYEIQQIVVFLNAIGALTVKRQLKSKPLSMFVKAGYYLHGRRPLNLTRRSNGTISSQVAVLLQSSAVIIYSMAALGFFLVTLGFSLKNVLLLFVSTVGQFLVSFVAHEYGHALLLRSLEIPYHFIANGTRFGVLHESTTHDQELWVAITGILSGILAAIGVGIILVPYLGYQAIATTALVVISHLSSLLPMFGDGKAVFEFINSNRKLRSVKKTA